MRQLKFKLGGSEWKLRWKKNLSPESDGKTFAECHSVDRMIFLSKEELVGKPDLAARTLFHELIHAALHLGGQDERLLGKQEEGIVVCLENILWPMLLSGELEKLLEKVRKAANGEV